MHSGIVATRRSRSGPELPALIETRENASRVAFESDVLNPATGSLASIAAFDELTGGRARVGQALQLTPELIVQSLPMNFAFGGVAEPCLTGLGSRADLGQSVAENARHSVPGARCSMSDETNTLGVCPPAAGGEYISLVELLGGLPRDRIDAVPHSVPPLEVSIVGGMEGKEFPPGKVTGGGQHQRGRC